MFDFIEDKDLKVQAEKEYETSINDLKDAHKLELDEQLSGLKSKNTELLDEKKKLQQKAKEYEDFDFEKAKEAMAFLENNADAKLIKDGKVEELIAKKTSVMRSDHEAEISELTHSLEESSKKGTLYEGLYKTKMVEDALREAALAANVRPEAITDILLRGRNIFSLAEDGSVEARDIEGKLKKTADDKVLTTNNWIEGLKKTSPHYWPQSVGADAFAGGGTDTSELTVLMEKALAEKNFAEFRRLREKQLKNKK